MKEIPGFFDYCIKRNINAIIEFVTYTNNKEAINELANHHAFYVREKVAHHHLITEENLAKLVADESPHVRHEVAKNPNLNRALKLILFQDKSAAYIFAKFNKNITPEDVLDLPYSSLFENPHLNNEAFLAAIKLLKPRWQILLGADAKREPTTAMLHAIVDYCEIKSCPIQAFFLKAADKDLYLKLLNLFPGKNILKEMRNRNHISREEFETLIKNMEAAKQF